jgi:hypothetical protein
MPGFPYNSRMYNSVKENRQYIEHLVIHTDENQWTFNWEPDWDWPLKIKWATIPRLRTLQIDLGTFSRWPYMEKAMFSSEMFMAKLVEGAGFMSCLWVVLSSYPTA